MNQLEQDVTQQETQLKLKESESKSLQNEYETLNQMLKQLENQKVEANRRLGEMDVQVSCAHCHVFSTNSNFYSNKKFSFLF